MRADMHKVLGERARVGGGWVKNKSGARRNVSGEDLPERESMRPRSRGAELKRTNEHLSPLRRYLNSQVGRLWDDVYSEICEHNKPHSEVKRRLREHVSYMVHCDVTLVDGEPKSSRGFGIWRDFWVNPETGVLMAAPQSKRFRWRGFRKDHEQVPVDSTHKYVKVDGIWYLVTFEPIVDGIAPFDVIYKDNLSTKPQSARTKLEREWGAAIFAVGKRQIGKRQIKKVAQIRARIERDLEKS